MIWLPRTKKAGAMTGALMQGCEHIAIHLQGA